VITKKTVLILGAGASKDYGFPLGQKLRDDICGMWSTRTGALAAIETASGNIDVIGFTEKLKTSGYTSVDWFLEDYPHFIEAGKYAIASVLIPHEVPKKLFPPHQPTAHWYEVLLNTLDTPPGSFSDNNLSVVTFNYDRSLEYYFLKVLETRRGSPEKAINEMKSLEVVHVHGWLGELAPYALDGRSYSPEIEPGDISKAAENIMVIGEASEETEAFARARELLKAAERIVFLGFGYHEKSVQRLEVFNEPWDEEKRQKVRVGGTVRGIPEHRWQNIRSKILNEAFPSKGKRGRDVFSYLNEVEPLDQ